MFRCENSRVRVFSAVPDLQVSRGASRKLEEFSDEFRAALVLGDVEMWAEALGLVRTTNALKSTFPLPLDAAGYKELKGDIKFRSLYSRSMSMTTKEWSDGVSEKARVIAAPDFIDWAGAPANMAREWLRLPNEIVADTLAISSYDGPLLDFYRDEDSKTASTRRLFATDHPYNVLRPTLGVFNNTTTTTVAQILDGTLYETLSEYFRSIKGPNGKPLGLRFTSGKILARGEREQTLKKSLEQERLVRAVQNVAGTENVGGAAVDNLWKGSAISYLIADELNSADYMYAFADGRPGLYPWVVQTEGAPEEIIHDESSEMYKSSRKLGIAYVGAMNAAAALPHGIVRIQITG